METQLGYLLEVIQENTVDMDILTAGDLKKYINLAFKKHEEAEERLDQEYDPYDY